MIHHRDAVITRSIFFKISTPSLAAQVIYGLSFLGPKNILYSVFTAEHCVRSHICNIPYNVGVVA